jgi:sporulation protein YlmC with PRC-barrel domain
VSDIEHSGDLADLLNYAQIQSGMEIITENGIRLGQTISIDRNSQSGSAQLLFVDSIHPMLNFYASIYQIPILAIIAIGHNRILTRGDIIPEIIETKVGIFRSLNLVDSLNTKLDRKKLSYHRIERASSYHRSGLAERVALDFDNSIEQIDWANDGWEYNMDRIDRDEDFWFDDNLDWNDDDPNIFDNDRWDDDDLPGAGVLRPKKPNPNLPPSMILVDDE